MPSRRLPFVVRLFCALNHRLLPAELVATHGRDINETFLDLYQEATATGRWLRCLRLLGRELVSLLGTAYTVRRALRGERRHLLSLRATPRTSAVAPRSAGRLFAPVPATDPPSPFVWLVCMLETIFQDVRYAFRTLRRSPVFTAVAVLTLALGIGANTAVFSVVHTVLLKPLPYEDPDRLVVVWTDFGRDLPQNWISGPEYAEIAELNTTLESFAVMSTDTAALTGDGGEPIQILQGTVSGAFFEVMRAKPQIGRLFGNQEDEAEQTVAVVTDEFWRTRMGARDDAVGSTLLLDNTPFEVIGILPPGFQVLHPNISDPGAMVLYTPMQPTYATTYEAMNRGSHFLLGIGRMMPGVTLPQAQADLDTVATRMAEITGGYQFDGWGLTVYSLHGDLVETSSSALVVLLGAVGFVLLIACVNVANLQLARAASRGREIALRTALGAGSRRLIRQLLTESMVLATLGAAAGIGLAFWLIRALVWAAPLGLPRADDISLDPSVLAFAGAITLLTAPLFGVAPGIFAVRTNLVDALKEGSRTASSGRAGNRARTALVVAEVALALVLLVGAGLMLRSFTSLVHTDPGYRTESILTLRIDLPQPKYDTDTAMAFHLALLDRVRAIPSVLSAGSISALPLSGRGGSGTTLAEHTDSDSVDEWNGTKNIEADRRYVTPGYFETMGTQLIAGRTFTDADNADAPLVAIVDETFAQRFWGESDAIGERVAISWNQDPDGHGFSEIFWAEVVGVVRHARNRNLSADGREQGYYPMLQRPRFGMHLAVRTDGDPNAVAAAVRQQVWDLDPDQPLSDVATMSERVAQAVATPRFNSILLASFAAVALILSALGIYGVISFSVGQRTNEIGVRMALGASRSSVRAMVLRQGMFVVLAGLVLGIGAALGLTRLISNMLYVVSPIDPITFVSVAGVLLAVAVLACLIPATRATRVEPVAALREE